MHTLWQDFRYGARMLLKHPGVTAIAVITLALGIGANTAIFSVVSAVMLRPLPYENPERLVALWENVPERGRWRVTPANFFDWKKQNTTFENIAAFGASTLTLTGDGEPEQIFGTRASSVYLLQDMTVLLRTTSDPTALVPSLRSAVLAIDPNQPITNINTMEKIVTESIAQPD